jgi:glycerophosphoryl diester phosphodiesterase
LAILLTTLGVGLTTISSTAADAAPAIGSSDVASAAADAVGPHGNAAPHGNAVPHGNAAAHRYGVGFDLEGHRGSRGLRPEDTLPAFSKALDLGVTTLELDTGITKDGVVIVSHQRRVDALVCVDTHPAFPGDPLYPYVGRTFRELSFAQVETVDCGTRHPADPATDPFVASQLPVPGTRIPTLDDVFRLVERRHASQVQLNIETKVDPTNPSDTLAPGPFTRAVVRVIASHRGGIARSLLQSFDWRTLRVARAIAPRLRRVALVDAGKTQIGQPGASPWLGGLDIDDPAYGGDPAKAATTVNADVLSPDYKFLTPAMLASAHGLGQLVVPWTVEDVGTMTSLIKAGVDGIITDYPDRGRDVMPSLGMRLPRAYPAR